MEKLDYQEFHDESVRYIPLRIDDEWLIENEEYIKEVLFVFHQIYDKSREMDNYNSLLKLYGEVLNITFQNFNVGYL